MKKTGNVLLLACLLPLLMWHAGSAQNVEIVATVSDNMVMMGERFGFSLEVKGSGFRNLTRPQAPQIDGLRLLNPSPSTSSNFSIVNGKASSSYIYTFYYLATKEGRVVFPKTEIQIDGKTQYSNEVSLEVVANRRANDPNATESADLFLKMELSDRSPVVGQQIVVDLDLYFKSSIDVQSYQPVPGWKTDGFWKEELNTNKQPKAVSTIINGQRYNKATLLSFALFPSRDGTLTIEPYHVNTSVRYQNTRRDPFSSFFGGFGGSQRSFELKTDPITLKVRSISGDDPAFFGAVGSFEISRKASINEAVVGETIEVQTVIKGQGNIGLITKPEYEFPSGFELYEPQENSTINNQNGRIAGVKTYTDIVVPRTPGRYALAEKTVAFFDPSANRLRRVVLPKIEFNVIPNPNAITSGGASIQTFGVRPMLGLVSWRRSNSESLPIPLLFWVLSASPFVLLFFGFIGKLHFDRIESDPEYARRLKAGKKTDSTFQRAEKLAKAGDFKEAYAGIFEAVTGYVTDKKNLPIAGWSNSEIVDAVKAAISDEEAKQLKRFLDTCASIQFAPIKEFSAYQKDAELAKRLLKKLRGVL